MGLTKASTGLLAAALLLALGAALLAAPPAAAQGTQVQQEGPEPVDDPHDACPDESNPPAPFTDRAGIPTVHRLNVDCAFNNDIAEGFTDQTFRPRDRVRRDQFASFLVRTLREGGVDLPEATDQGFTDIQGNPHEDNINILARTGITAGRTATRYDPGGLLLRDQTATFVLRAAAYVEDASLESLQRPTGPFTDVPEGNVHATNINGARHFNLTIGQTATTYQPSSPTRRDQMASFLIRLFASLTADGHLIPPQDRVTDIEFDTRVAVNPVAESHTATATATDAVGDPVVGVPVRFEIFRHDNPVVEAPQFTYLADLERVVHTGQDGRASITYTGPNHAADDRIAVCVPRSDTQVPATGPFCGIVVDDDDGEGETVVPTDAVPADVAQKKWGFPADALHAEAIGLRGELLGQQLLEQPVSSITLPGPAGQRSAVDTDGMEIGEIGGLLYLGVTTTRAAGDLDFGIAHAEARTVDLELLGLVGGQPLVGADVIHTVSTITCEGPYDDLADASDSTFAGLVIGGQEIPVQVPPNTRVEIPSVADVVVNEVIPHTDDDTFGYTVRGLRITLLQPTDLQGAPLTEIIVGETTTTADCAD
ncbi:MAG TPA: choice-of-anchor P family protein [Egibacteraceae bacterium]|nr:choice-of-anchor P family protein [Egibacteraceae bacterium]